MRAIPACAMLLALAAPAVRAAPGEASAPAGQAAAVPPARLVAMSTGTGQLLRLPRPVARVFIADDKIADVQVKGQDAVYLFARAPGLTSVYATDRAGAVVWSADVRVGANVAEVDALLRAALPDADVSARPVGDMLLLTGTVLAPKDAEEAQRLAEQATAGTVQVLNHLKFATPQQVMLQVKIAEVNRTLARQIGVNLLGQGSGNPIASIAQGSPGTITYNATDKIDAASGVRPEGKIFTFKQLAGTTLGLAGRAFGADFLATLQLNENNGQVHTLAEPTLVALSGETASFLAGGEIPIPQSQGLGAVSVTYKQYGVSLAFTPTVLSGGRIAIRVRPEVSELTDVGSVKVNDFTIPALVTRRAETTVELGSGQSFAIGGLLQNNHNNSTDKAPLLGDLPIIGALFRSNSFRKSETELVIVVTPYLVKPVDANRIALPTDGYRSPDTASRVLLDQSYQGVSGEARPVPQPAAAGRP